MSEPQNICRALVHNHRMVNTLHICLSTPHVVVTSSYHGRFRHIDSAYFCKTAVRDEVCLPKVGR